MVFVVVFDVVLVVVLRLAKAWGMVMGIEQAIKFAIYL